MEEKLFTRRGFRLAQARIKDLDAQLRKLESTLALQAETGGNAWHDNAGYEDTVRQVGILNTRLTEAHKVVRGSHVVDLPSSNEVVAIGTKVKINVNGAVQTWTIMGYHETDIDTDIISYNTPLAELLLGHSIGDVVDGRIGKREVQITVLEISLLGGLDPAGESRQS